MSAYKCLIVLPKFHSFTVDVLSLLQLKILIQNFSYAWLVVVCLFIIWMVRILRGLFILCVDFKRIWCIFKVHFFFHLSCEIQHHFKVYRRMHYSFSRSIWGWTRDDYKIGQISILDRTANQYEIGQPVTLYDRPTDQ